MGYCTWNVADASICSLQMRSDIAFAFAHAFLRIFMTRPANASSFVSDQAYVSGFRLIRRSRARLLPIFRVHIDFHSPALRRRIGYTGASADHHTFSAFCAMASDFSAHPVGLSGLISEA